MLTPSRDIHRQLLTAYIWNTGPGHWAPSGRCGDSPREARLNLCEPVSAQPPNSLGRLPQSWRLESFFLAAWAAALLGLLSSSEPGKDVIWGDMRPETPLRDRDTEHMGVGRAEPGEAKIQTRPPAPRAPTSCELA